MDGCGATYAPFKFSSASVMIGGGDGRNEPCYDNLDLPVYLPSTVKVVDGRKVSRVQAVVFVFNQRLICGVDPMPDFQHPVVSSAPDNDD